jgi:hypothetical protein
MVFSVIGRGVDGAEKSIASGFTKGVHPRFLDKDKVIFSWVGTVENKVVSSLRFVSVLLPDGNVVRHVRWDPTH